MGKTGTWDPRDHDTFIRVWNSLLEVHELQSIFDGLPADCLPEIPLPPGQRSAVVKKAVQTVPGKKSSDVEEHISW